MSDNGPVHPLIAAGTVLSTVGAFAERWGLILLGLALSWACLWLDLRVWGWIQRRASGHASEHRTTDNRQRTKSE
jgi:hypothetical protein